MKRITQILLLCFLFPLAGAQKDPEAKKVLDRLSEKSRKDYPISVEFEYLYEDLMEKHTSTHDGTLIIDGNKFLLTMEESVVYCDGLTMWNHLIAANEVYVSDAGEDNSSDGFFINNPSDLFTFYEEGFKYRHTGFIEHKGKSYTEIDIFPEDLDKDYHTVKLLIDEKKLEIYSARAFGKGGTNHSVILKGYKTGVKTHPESFRFIPDEHPGVEIIDTRF